jgi:spore germination cell wall hydrolase CwlJ-like protein
VAYRVASLETYTPRVTAAVAPGTVLQDSEADSAVTFPTVDRHGKGNRLPLHRQQKPAASSSDRKALPPVATSESRGGSQAPTTAPTDRAGLSLAAQPRIEPARPPEAGVWPAPSVSGFAEATKAARVAGLYFGADSLDAPRNAFEWTSAAQAAAEAGGESIAGKGEVTGKDKTPRSLADRLHLSKKQRVKAEKCLAEAVYFEARGEPVRGQIAVAQVVMNRVFSPFYPDEVCAVVYQNANRRLACQFTFACDGIPEVVTEPEAWRRAKAIAKDTLDGKLWLPEIGKATHYHAYWVHPSWVHEMRKLYKVGVHTFYRPRAWGNGSDEPVWGSAKITAELVKKL